MPTGIYKRKETDHYEPIAYTPENLQLNVNRFVLTEDYNSLRRASRIVKRILGDASYEKSKLKKKSMKKLNNLEEFLSQSNAIEGVYDEDSLQQALGAWSYLIAQPEMSVHTILKVHKILMLHQKLYPNEKGYFRTVPVYIGGEAAINAEKIDSSIKQWVLNVNDIVQNGKKEPKQFLEDMMKTHHVNYEKIHPFVDGNGRTGRMFMNWERLQVGLPLLIIHEGDEQMEYYKWFK